MERLLPPRQAIVAFFSRVAVRTTGVEHVALDDALGRVLAESIAADQDYPAARRSLMDGYAVCSEATPGEFAIVDDVRMGAMSGIAVSRDTVARIPTGGVLPGGADSVVPVEDAPSDGARVTVPNSVPAGENVVQPGADMRQGEVVLHAHRRIRAAEVGVLATLGVTRVPVFRKPIVAVFSSGDEIVEPHARPATGEIRDSNRYAVAASLRAMGASPRHYPTLRDEAPEFEAALERAVHECDAAVVTGGSSVGERDRLPRAVAAIADPGIIVHGLRIKPGKPALLAADGGKPIVGLPGNPASALLVLEAVAAPIFAALCGAPVVPATLHARLAETARSRAGWTWHIPVRLQEEGSVATAYPLAVRSFSVSLAARADGYIVMEERDEAWPAGTAVTVVRFLEGHGA